MDDEELAAIALNSSLADLKEVVISGDFGAPFSIGDYGFYANSQFDAQSQLLCDIERVNSQADYYLSKEEWDKIDDYLSQIGAYGTSYFPTVGCGDTFGVLAVKKNAYKVAMVFLEAGLDPLIENEEGEDLFHATKKQYQVLSIRLRILIERQDQFMVSTQIRGEWLSITNEEKSLLNAWRNKVTFLRMLIANLTRRLDFIEADIVMKRRCELLNEVKSFLVGSDSNNRAKHSLLNRASLRTSCGTSRRRTNVWDTFRYAHLSYSSDIPYLSLIYYLVRVYSIVWTW